ncbi:hypothetical protein [Spongiimicrobium sp. 3-5]|uniref:hypothetical protein n=1 Tax=Spongiimicrobium sp. 3-5 TaxID=3332596 RepID=UPI00397EC3D2
MKKTTFLLSFLMLWSYANAQLDDTGSTSNGSMSLGTGTGTLYQFAGDQRGTDATNQSQGGFGILSGSNQISPIIWMYSAGDKNAFQVRKKGYNSTVQNGTTLLHIGANGKVGIGTTNPDMKLTVNGHIHAEEVKIDLSVPAPDYVFKKDYNLRSIEEVEEFIKENSHLPEIPSAKEFEQHGVMQAEMDMNLLKKIEELTLYTIQQQKEIEELKLQNKRLLQLQLRLEKLESEN